MAEGKTSELKRGELDDKLAADWFKERSVAKPEEIVGSLLAKGAYLENYSMLDLNKTKGDKDLVWKPEELPDIGSRRVFKLQGNAQASIYSVLKFKYGLERALVTSPFDGEKAVNLYYIPYLRQTRFPLVAAPSIEEKGSAIIVLREDQVKDTCQALDIKLPASSD